jgi:tRNA nucleotidyltransferase/poly(A) polymerase
VSDSARFLTRRLRASPVLRRVWEACAPAPVYLTGGYLRDRFLGRPSHDIDLVVEGDAGPVAAGLGDRVGGRSFALGHGPTVTWRVAAGRWRLDVEGIAPGALWEDAMRRDFAANALLWRLPRGPLLDPAGGLADLEVGRLRVIRAENLRADPLRVLRGVRLLATRPELSLDAEAEALLRDAAPGLTRVARERVTEELRQLLTGPAVARALRAAARLEALGALHPSWAEPHDLETLALLAARLAVLASAPNSRLAEGARAVAAATLAAPAAGFPHGWEEPAAAAALTAMGWPPRAADTIAAGAALGERLAAALHSRQQVASRTLAVDHPRLVVAGTAWAVARAEAAGDDLETAARKLLRWHARFQRRAPVLGGDEVAALLRLPPGHERADAVAALRRARARGEVRTRGQAVRWLASHFPEGDRS